MNTSIRTANPHSVGSFMNMISHESRSTQEAILIQLMRLLSKPSTVSLNEIDYKEKVMELCGAWNDDPRNTEQIKEDIRNARVSGETRHLKEWPV